MKIRNVFLLLMMTISLFLFTGSVYAENENVCSVLQLSELREIASGLKVTYVPITKVIDIPEDVETGATKYTARYMDIKIYNMNSKLYIEATNDRGYNEIANINNLSKDGAITFRQEVINEKINYTFTVKSTEYGCDNQVLRTIKLTLPIYNPYSQLDICTDIPDYYLCQEYVTSAVDGSTFYDKVDAYKAKLLEQVGNKEEEDNTGTVNKVFAGVSKYKYFIVGIIVALGVVITVVVIKRKENML